MPSEFKKISKNFFVYGIGSIANRAITMLMIPIYTRYLVPAEYGRLELIYLLITIFTNLLGMGISSATLRFYFDQNSTKDRKAIISTAILTSCIICLCLLFLLSLFTQRISQLLLESTEYSNHIYLVLITVFFSVTEEVPMAYLRAREFSTLYAMTSFLKLSLYLALNIYFVIFKGMGIWGILLSQSLGSGCICIMLLVFALQQNGLCWSLKKCTQMIKYGTPLIGVNIGLFIIISSDRLFLKHFANFESIAIYAIAYKFALILRVLIITPFMANFGAYRFAIMKKEEAKKIYSKTLTYFLLLLSCVGLIIVIFIQEILLIFTTDEYSQASQIVPILVIGYICFGAYYILQVGLYVEKKTNIISKVIMFTALFNIGTNYLLVPKLSIYGAAIASGLSFFLMAILTNFLSQRVYPISYENSRIYKIAALMIPLSLLSYIFPFKITISIIVTKILIIVSIPFLLWCFNFFDHKEKSIIKQKITHWCRLNGF